MPAAQALKTYFAVPTNGTQQNPVGTHTGYLIDHVADTTYIEFCVPNSYSFLADFSLVYIPHATNANGMNATITFNYGNPGQAFNNRTNNANALVLAAVTQNEIHYQDISNLVTNAFVRFDWVGVRIVYAAAGGAEANSNMTVLGTHFRWA